MSFNFIDEIPKCAHCELPATLTSGRSIFYKKDNAYNKTYWHCRNCNSYCLSKNNIYKRRPGNRKQQNLWKNLRLFLRASLHQKYKILPDYFFEKTEIYKKLFNIYKYREWSIYNLNEAKCNELIEDILSWEIGVDKTSFDIYCIETWPGWARKWYEERRNLIK